MRWLRQHGRIGVRVLLLGLALSFCGCSSLRDSSPYSQEPASAKYRRKATTYRRDYEEPSKEELKAAKRKAAEERKQALKEERSRRAAAAETTKPTFRASAPVRAPVETTPVGNGMDSLSSAYTLKSGDVIVIDLRGIPKEERIEDIIDEGGNVTLPYINTVHAVGKTSSDLEREIRRLYLGAKIYKDITVTVMVPTQGYYVRGEVKKPGRYAMMSGMTMLQAISAAGGYTEFARPSRVRLLRRGTSQYLDLKEIEKHPEKDMLVEVGDVIVVERSPW